jgi:anti-sigma B factor antagonist
MGDQLTVSVSSVDGCTVVALAGESDVNTVRLVQEALAAQVKARACRVVVDLSGLRFIGSLGMCVLLETQEALMARGGSLALACPQRVVARMLELSGIDQRVPVYGSIGEAAAGRVQCF